MNNSTLNSLRKQLTFEFMLDFNVELDSQEIALMTLFENLDYSAFWKNLGRHDKISPDKMMILLVHGAVNNKTSCRDLEKLVNRDLFMKAVFGPDVKVDHSTISRFIKKYPKEIEDVFYQSVKQLDKLGELGKKVVFQDGTKIESRANKYSFVWKSYTEKNREKCLIRMSTIISEATELNIISFVKMPQSEQELVTAIKSIIQTVEEKGLFDYTAKRGSGHKKNKINDLYLRSKTEFEKLSTYNYYLSNLCGRNSLSKTDIDATFMHMKEDYMRNGQLKPGYNIQNAVDSNYVVASSISSDRTDYNTVPHILEKLHNYDFKYEVLCADSGYDSLTSYHALEEEGIEAYIKPQDWEISKTRKYQNDIGKSINMKYVKDGDYFICANNKKLEFIEVNKKDQARMYRCSRGCVTCPFRTSCIRNSKKNKVKKMSVQLEHQKYQRLAYEKLTTAFGCEVRANRSIQVEGRFAEIKQQLGLRRFSSFGKTRVFTEWLLACMASNVVQLAARIEQEKVGIPFWYKIEKEKIA